jgi:SAM-dependent methyltransferase
MHDIDLTIFNHPIRLSYNDIELLRKFAPLQMGEHQFYEITTTEEFIEKFAIFIRYNFQRTAQFIGWDHSIRKVIDVGSGISTFDLILHKLLQSVNPTKSIQSKFYLVDKSERTGGHSVPYVNDASEHGFYNSWDCVNDCIATSNISKENFIFLTPEENWPSDVDLIVSQYSWLWHYPSQTYLERAYASLRPGGKLIVDIMNVKNRDQVGEISKVFKNPPVAFMEYPCLDNIDDLHPFFKKPINELYHIVDGNIGQTCCWIKT